MANTKSAKKTHRQEVRRRVHNARRKRTMKDSVKEIGKLIASKDSKKVLSTLPAFYKAVDKAQKRGIIHANTAARMKSRVTKRAAELAK